LDLICFAILKLFAEGDQELARDQEFQDTPFDQGKPQYSGHGELELYLVHLKSYLDAHFLI